MCIGLTLALPLQVRFVVTETLRLYPEPPILIRRALEQDTLPVAHAVGGGLQKNPAKVHPALCIPLW